MRAATGVKCHRTSVAEVVKKKGVADQTIDVSCQRFGGPEPADVTRLRHQRQKNGRMRRPVAERDLAIEDIA